MAQFPLTSFQHLVIRRINLFETELNSLFDITECLRFVTILGMAVRTGIIDLAHIRIETASRFKIPDRFITALHTLV